MLPKKEEKRQLRLHMPQTVCTGTMAKVSAYTKICWRLHVQCWHIDNFKNSEHFILLGSPSDRQSCLASSSLLYGTTTQHSQPWTSEETKEKLQEEMEKATIFNFHRTWLFHCQCHILRSANFYNFLYPTLSWWWKPWIGFKTLPPLATFAGSMSSIFHRWSSLRNRTWRIVLVGILSVLEMYWKNHFLLLIYCLWYCYLVPLSLGQHLLVWKRRAWEYTETTNPPSFTYVQIAADGICKEPTPFTSIPASFWWFFVTATTVVYGGMLHKIFIIINLIPSKKKGQASIRT